MNFFKDPALQALFETDLATLIELIGDTKFQPREKFTHGQLVAINDQPYEVVLEKDDGTVYVKDENGRVTGHPSAWVKAL
jgi:hypothetical protein